MTDRGEMGSGGIAVEFSLTRREWGRGLRAAGLRSPSFFVLPILGCVVVLAGLNVSKMTVVAVGVLLVLATPLLAFMESEMSWRRQPQSRATQRYLFDSRGVEVATVDAESRVAWSFYSGMDETREFFILRYQKRICFLLPKRAFGSESDAERFRELVDQNLSTKASGRSA